MLNQTTEKTAEDQQRRHGNSTITSHVLRDSMIGSNGQEDGEESVDLSHLSFNVLHVDAHMRNATPWPNARRTRTSSPAWDYDDDDGDEESYEEVNDDDGIMEIYSLLKAAIEISEDIPLEDDGGDPTLQLVLRNLTSRP